MVPWDSCRLLSFPALSQRKQGTEYPSKLRWPGCSARGLARAFDWGWERDVVRAGCCSPFANYLIKQIMWGVDFLSIAMAWAGRRWLPVLRLFDSCISFNYSYIFEGALSDLLNISRSTGERGEWISYPFPCATRREPPTADRVIWPRNLSPRLDALVYQRPSAKKSQWIQCPKKNVNGKVWQKEINPTLEWIPKVSRKLDTIRVPKRMHPPPASVACRILPQTRLFR